GTDEPLMVEEGPPESTHEKIVRQRVFLGDLPHRCLGTVPQAHHQSAGIAIGNELVVASAMDLHLVLVVTMPEVASNGAVADVESLGVVGPEGTVRKMLRLSLGHRRCHTLAGQTLPNRRQLPQTR